MRHRGIIALGLLAPALLLSGCTGAASVPQAWWDDDEIGARFSAGSGGGALSIDRDSGSPALLSLGGASAGAYRAEAACAGPPEITVIIAGTSTVIECAPHEWTIIEFELERTGTLTAEVPRGVAGGGSWYVGFDHVEA